MCWWTGTLCDGWYIILQQLTITVLSHLYLSTIYPALLTLCIPVMNWLSIPACYSLIWAYVQMVWHGPLSNMKCYFSGELKLLVIENNTCFHWKIIGIIMRLWINHSIIICLCYSFSCQCMDINYQYCAWIYLWIAHSLSQAVLIETSNSGDWILEIVINPSLHMMTGN